LPFAQFLEKYSIMDAQNIQLEKQLIEAEIKELKQQLYAIEE